jgi:hypothetical protein
MEKPIESQEESLDTVGAVMDDIKATANDITRGQSTLETFLAKINFWREQFVLAKTRQKISGRSGEAALGQIKKATPEQVKVLLGVPKDNLQLGADDISAAEDNKAA